MEQVKTGTDKLRALLERDGQVLRLVVDDPPGNVLAAEVLQGISGVLEREGERAELKAIVFEGQGKHFSFGASVEEHQKEQAPAMIHAFHGLFKQLLALDVPCAALVRGQCLGGALELVCFCHFILAEPSARLGLPEITLAVFPPVAAAILPDLIGRPRAEDLILTGRSIDASVAESWGLVHRVADRAEEALDELLEKQLLPKSAAALRFGCRAARAGWHERLGADLDRMERLYVDELMESDDASEGIAAFLQKRSPEWKNR
ncbi:MAG: enoyl-CoA hydratase/isomerase family protein [Deltaproteobacteria bacterium]|nr:enoyl-CoA hydratase/isomerase family protein [Deltaproteobacteria bacterium]